MRKLKLFSLALMALFSTSLWGTDLVITGYKGGSTTTGSVKIHNNSDSQTSICKFANSWSSGANFYSIKTAGGFKEGDVVNFSGVINSGKADKYAKIVIYAANKSNQLYISSANVIDGNNSASDPTPESYTLTSDQDSLLFARDGNTGLFLLTLSVNRPGEVITYTVTYKAGTGTGADVVDDAATSVADCPNTFSKSGYQFVGWKDAGDNDVAVGDDVTSDMTLTAQWSELFSVTFDAGEGSGTVPTEADHIAGASFELPGQGSMTHASKVLAGWIDQDDNEFEVGDSYTMPAKDVTLTAQWMTPYTVTYNANGGTGDPIVRNNPATIEACSFTAPSEKVFAGWNTAADGTGDPYAVGASVSSTLVLYAQWKDVILLIKSGDVLNTEDFVIYTGTELDATAYTVNSTNYTSNFKMGNTASAIAGQAWANKFMAYDVQSTSVEIKLYIYNKNSNAKNLYYQVIKEGNVGSLQTVSVASKGSGQVVTVSVSTTKGARVVFGVESTDVRFCQIQVMENGTALPTAMTVGYELMFPGRAATADKACTIDGIELKTYNDIKFASGISYLALRNIDGTQYVKFTTDEEIQLQVTTANSNKFYVCEASIGDAENDTQYGGSAGTHNVNLSGSTTYYIVPTAGSSSGEVQITKLAFAEPPIKYTVTYSAGTGSVKEGQSLPTQAATYAGEKFNLASAGNLEKSDYDFDGWLCSADAAKYAAGDEYTMTAEATTFTAQWKEHVLSSDATLADLKVNGETVAGFAAATVEYNVELPFGTTVVPTVAATANSPYAKSVSITQASSVSGVASVVVTAENNSTKTYTINFSVSSSKDLLLVFRTSIAACVGTPSVSDAILSNNAAVSTYINQITFDDVEGTGDNGKETGGKSGSLDVGKKAGNMFTLSVKKGYAFKEMSFKGKIQDANCEYSLDGGEWTTLTSTDISNDDCYNPFSDAEVTQFRLRSTGNSGVWIRNMQLTIINSEKTPTALDNTVEETKAVKVLENGMLIIEKNGVRYNVTGQVIK